MRLTWLPEVLRAAGLRVVEEPGWKTRGSDDFDPLGIICHATAGATNSSDAGEIRVLINGSNSAPPPIAPLYLSRTGTVHIVASGRCNHALVGTAGRLKGHGNRRLIGIEAANNNRGEPWPAAQVDAYVRMVAAICKRMGWDPESRVSGHREHQPGQKTDPHGIDMNSFRSRAKALVAGKGIDMFGDAQAQQLTDIHFNTVRRGDPPRGVVIHVQEAREAILAEQRAATAAILAALAADGTDTEAIKQAIAETSAREVQRYGEMLDAKTAEITAEIVPALAEAIRAELGDKIEQPVLEAAMEAALRSLAGRVAGVPPAGSATGE